MRVLWKIGLSIALFFFGLVTIMLIAVMFYYRHASVKGILLFISNAYTFWFVLQFMRSRGYEDTPQTENPPSELLLPELWKESDNPSHPHKPLN